MRKAGESDPFADDLGDLDFNINITASSDKPEEVKVDSFRP